MILVVLLAAGLTFVLGSATALAFVLVGGREALLGTGNLWQSWPVIYSLVALFALAVMSVVGYMFSPRLSLRGLLGVAMGAWFGQYLVLASGLMADELTPLNSVYFWILATGGPIQPAAAILGAWLGRRTRLGRADQA